MLKDVLYTLKSHEAALKQAGVIHAAVFGSTGRGEQVAGSDIDVLIDLDGSRAISVFDYAAIKDMIADFMDGPVDVVTREGLKEGIRERVLVEAVDAF